MNGGSTEDQQRMIEELTEDDRRTNGGRMEIDRRANDSKTICNMFFYYNIVS